MINLMVLICVVIASLFHIRNYQAFIVVGVNKYSMSIASRHSSGFSSLRPIRAPSTASNRIIPTHLYLSSHIPVPFTIATSAPPPDVEKARLVLQIKGDTVNNALFRAELKKELTFFRGCSAVYIQNGEDTAEIVTEGKTKKLLTFIDWLSALSLSVSQRRPSFQGPNLVGGECLF